MFGGDASECHVRALVIVCPDPVRAVVLNFSYRFKQVMPLPVVMYRAVIAFDVSVLLRVARLNIFQTDTLFLGPSSEFGTDEFGAVISLRMVCGFPRHSMT